MPTGGRARGCSEAARPGVVGPIGPSAVGAGAPNVTQEISDLASVTVDVSQYFHAVGSTLRYEYSTTNHALATVDLNGEILTIAKTPNVTGTASITVTAITATGRKTSRSIITFGVPRKTLRVL